VLAAGGARVGPCGEARQPQELTDAALVVAVDALDGEIAAAGDAKPSGRARLKMLAVLVAAAMGGTIDESFDLRVIGARLEKQASRVRARVIDGERDSRIVASLAAEGDAALAATLPALLAASEAAEAAELERLAQEAYVGFGELELPEGEPVGESAVVRVEQKQEEGQEEEEEEDPEKSSTALQCDKLMYERAFASGVSAGARRAVAEERRAQADALVGILNLHINKRWYRDQLHNIVEDIEHHVAVLRLSVDQL